MKRPSLICVFLTGVLAAQGAPAAGTVKVFVLAGQSNMQGQGAVNTLPWLGEDKEHGALLGRIRNADGSWKTRDDVWVYYPRGKGKPRQGKLTVGFGARDDTIGPELFFGDVMGDYFAEPVLLVKTCWGGRSLAVDFRPPGSGGTNGAAYGEMLDIVHDVTTRLGEYFPEFTGRKPELAGFVWFQGWNDMIDAKKVAEYETNLVHLIEDVRREWKTPRLPVVIGTLGVGGRAEAEKNTRMRDIRAAQMAPASRPEFAGTVACVATEDYWDETAYDLLKRDWLNGQKWHDPELKAQFDRMGNQPPYHYMGSGKVLALIGHAFGEAMKELLHEPDHATTNP